MLDFILLFEGYIIANICYVWALFVTIILSSSVQLTLLFKIIIVYI